MEALSGWPAGPCDYVMMMSAALAVGWADLARGTHASARNTAALIFGCAARGHVHGQPRYRMGQSRCPPLRCSCMHCSTCSAPQRLSRSTATRRSACTCHSHVEPWHAASCRPACSERQIRSVQRRSLSLHEARAASIRADGSQGDSSAPCR